MNQKPKIRIELGMYTVEIAGEHIVLGQATSNTNMPELVNKVNRMAAEDRCEKRRLMVIMTASEVYS